MMSVSTLKTVLTILINLQSLRSADLILKIFILKLFTEKREKLQTFLIKLKLYIEFNADKFTHKMNKSLFVTFYFKNTAFNWINLQLHKFLDKSSQKKKWDEILIYSDFQRFKKNLHQIFKIIDEKQTVK